MTAVHPETLGPSPAGAPARAPEAPGRRRPRRLQGPARVLAASLAAVLGIYGLSLYLLRPASPGKAMRLDTVLRAAVEGRVESARLLDQDSRIAGILVPAPGQEPVRFFASYPDSDAATNDLVRSLYSGGAQVTVDSQSLKSLVRFLAQFLLPMVLLANLFALLFSLTRSGGGTSEFVRFGGVGDRRQRSGAGRVTFADIASAEGPVAELAEVRDYLADPSAFRAMGALPPKGVLLVGPPGCGKTLLARALAGEANAAFFALSGSEFVESLVGVGAARVRDLFVQAAAEAPAILFIDELDAVGRQRGAGMGGGHDEREQTLNEMLVQMDGFSPSTGLIVLAATNRPDILDPALLRPGRFDRRVTVEAPDRRGRLDILRLHAQGKRLTNPAGDLEAVSRSTTGFTGADLSSLLNEAALLAVREGSSSIAMTHLDEAVERVVAGPRQRAGVITGDEKRRIACHEGAHAVVAAALGRAERIAKLSVVARGRGIGHLALAGGDRLLPTTADMADDITIALAGLAAEQLVLGDVSVGSEDDIRKATAMARDMAGRFGMSTRLGRARILDDEREVFLGRDYLKTRDVSATTLDQLDAEVRRILEDQEARAGLVLRANRSVLDSVAAALMEHETLLGPELAQLMASVKPAPPAPPVEALNGSSRASKRAASSTTARSRTASAQG